MTILSEVNMHSALVEYIRLQNAIADLRDDNCWYFVINNERVANVDGYTSMNQVIWTHPTIPKPDESTVISIYDNWMQTELAKIAATDSIKQVESTAESQVASIPAWASYTETEALDWHDTNITNAIAPIANLTDAKAILTKMATENRALIRMVIALRNRSFPNLEGN